jgi:hypothetical protein
MNLLRMIILYDNAAYMKDKKNTFLMRISERFGAFAKLSKATITFVMSVCPSVRLSVLTPRLTLDGSSLNLIFDYFFFENLSRKFKFH